MHLADLLAHQPRCISVLSSNIEKADAAMCIKLLGEWPGNNTGKGMERRLNLRSIAARVGPVAR